VFFFKLLSLFSFAFMFPFFFSVLCVSFFYFLVLFFCLKIIFQNLKFEKCSSLNKFSNWKYSYSKSEQFWNLNNLEFWMNFKIWMNFQNLNDFQFLNKFEFKRFSNFEKCTNPKSVQIWKLFRFKMFKLDFFSNLVFFPKFEKCSNFKKYYKK
jgi:hypothetical protein